MGIDRNTPRKAATRSPINRAKNSMTGLVYNAFIAHDFGTYKVILNLLKNYAGNHKFRYKYSVFGCSKNSNNFIKITKIYFVLDEQIFLIRKKYFNK
ncbi:hypothetical protein CEN49_25070 [Fischerella thermalis CCMEE 5273]|jgi:hypothetical protein